MKSGLSLLLIFLFIAVFNAKSFSQPSSEIEWETTEYDCGTISFNVPVKVEFTFKNPSLIPLIINEVEPSCDCSVADFPKQPILSGKSGEITVQYDAKKTGFFQKSFVVKTNAATKTSTLIIKGEVVKNN